MFKMLICVAIISLPIAMVANSSFSFDGYSYFNSNIDVYGRGMGNTGIADNYRYNTSFINPSLAVTNTQVTFSTSISFGNVKYLNNKELEFKDGFQYFPYFSFAFPLRNHRLGFNYSFIASGNYETINRSEWDDEAFEEVNSVSSNIYKTSILYANQNDFVNYGLSLDYYFGNRLRFWKQNFSQIGFINAKYEQKKYFKGPGFTLGLNKAFDNLSFGLVYNHKVEMTGDDELISIHTSYGKDDFAYEIPSTLRFGTTVKASDFFKTSFDFNFENWENLSDSYKDCFVVGLGLSYQPNRDDNQVFYNIPYRLGISYRNLPFEVNGYNVSQFIYSSGLSIPFSQPYRQLDISLQYITRGDKNKNITMDRSFMISLSYSGFDIFRKRIRRIEHREIPEAEFEIY